MNSVLVRVGCLQVIDIIRCWFGVLVACWSVSAVCKPLISLRVGCVLVRRVGSPLLRKGRGAVLKLPPSLFWNLFARSRAHVKVVDDPSPRSAHQPLDKENERALRERAGAVIAALRRDHRSRYSETGSEGSQ